MHFQNIPGGCTCPWTPRYCTRRIQSKYLPIIARFLPVKNLSYIPGYRPISFWLFSGANPKLLSSATWPYKAIEYFIVLCNYFMTELLCFLYESRLVWLFVVFFLPFLSIRTNTCKWTALDVNLVPWTHLEDLLYLNNYNIVDIHNLRPLKRFFVFFCYCTFYGQWLEYKIYVVYLSNKSWVRKFHTSFASDKNLRALLIYDCSQWNQNLGHHSDHAVLGW